MPQNKFRRFIAYLFILIIVSSCGYYILGGREWSFLDSIYMTIITLSTVGFSEIHDLNGATRIWTIFVIFFGVTGFAVIATQFAQEIADLKRYRRKRMENSIKKMSDHYIVCGFGRMGEVICDELFQKKQNFVVIEQRNMNIEILERKKYVYMAGDATNENVLMNAGLERAKGIVVVLGSDPDNLFVTMTARTLNLQAFILARCSTIGSNQKFKRAGADRVVNPYVAGGHKMAEMLLIPSLSDSVEISTDLDKDKTLELGIDQIDITSVTELIGKTLAESQLREKYNLMVLAIIEKGGKVILNPISTNRLKGGQKIMLTGHKTDLARFRKKIAD